MNDPDTLDELRKNQFRKRSQDFYSRGFGLIGDSKDKFTECKSSIEKKFKKLNGIEGDRLNTLNQIGLNAVSIQKLVADYNNQSAVLNNKSKRVNFKTVLKSCFGERTARIYEAMALSRALESGTPKTMPTTTLIRVGEKLGNQKTAKEMKTVLEKDLVALKGKIVKFSDLRQVDALKALKEIGAKKRMKATRAKALGDLSVRLNEIVKFTTEIRNAHNWKLPKNRNLVLASFAKVEDCLGILSEAIEDIKAELPYATSRPNSVLKKATAYNAKDSVTTI